MKKTLRFRFGLLVLMLVASCLTAKEKLLVVVQKSPLVNVSSATELAIKAGKDFNFSDKYELVSEDNLKAFYQKDFNKTENTTDNDLVKIANSLKADKVLSIMVQQKDESNLFATARVIDVQRDNDNLIAFNKMTYNYGFGEFMEVGLAGLLKPLASVNLVKIPEGSLVVTSNDTIKVFVDKKRVKDTFLSNLAMTEGFHEVYLQRKDGFIIDKQIVYFSEGKQISYNYQYTPKSAAITKSLILPGWGQFSTDRNVAGSIYASAAVGGLALIGIGAIQYSSSKDDYDASKNMSEKALLYQDRLASASLANGFRDDCKTAGNIVLAGVGVFAVSYIASFLDVYFTGNEHKLDINGTENPFSNLQFKGNSLVYSFPVNSNSEKHRNKQ